MDRIPKNATNAKNTGKIILQESVQKLAHSNIDPPDKQDSCSGPTDRIAWSPLCLSRSPIFNH